MVGCAVSVSQPLVEVAPGDGVVRELGQVWSGLLSVERFERCHRQFVQLDAAGAREPFIKGVADKDVREAEPTGVAGNVGEDAGGHRLVEPVDQLVL